ncbi:MAG TPA: RHS repeat domain-containing protein [Chitinophagaceae bacterium]
MKNILLAFTLLASFSLRAQYYYNDIIGTQETNRQMKTYLDNKVRTVSASGTDQRGVKATDFSEFHEIKENGKALKSTSIVNLNKSVIYSRFDDKGRVISMTDSSNSIESSTTYEYDAAGRITMVKNTVRDSANDFNQVEVHQWLYNANNKPEKMWRIINSSTNGNIADSLEIRFVADEDGNPGEERTFRGKVETGYLYYYYDDKDRLSDIVRYNQKLKKLMPDLLFEYDDKDRVTQKITTTSSINLGYLIWRYIYNDKGLKSKEALFNKEKELTGRIDYTYSFAQ